MWRIVWLAMILGPFAYSAVPAKPFVDCTREELVRAVPDLANLQFDSNQAPLDALLNRTGKNLQNSLANFVNVLATEQINELRFDQYMSAVARRETFQYHIALRPSGSDDLFQEVRLHPGTRSPVRPEDSEFLVLSHFYKLLAYLLPRYQDESRFRYLGEVNSDAQHYFVLAFAQHPESRLASHVAISPGRSAMMQGIVWIDGANNTVVRLRADLPRAIENVPIETLSTDILFSPVTFRSARGPILLPTRVVTNATSGSDEFHTVHRYVGYESAGEIVATAVPNDEDPYEVLAQGIASLKNNDADTAIGKFRASLRLDSAIPAAHFNLATALIAAGDLGGAETELREGVKLMPESVLFHDLLGVVLGKRGDTAGATAEFRTCIQILPKQASLHFNLANALERTGDRDGARAEYRMASELAPDNAPFKSELERFERESAAPGTTFRADVRQVMVPVVVTDKDGHHVTGLTRDDFRVFEDGLEQKITAFSVEDSGVGGGISAPGSARANAGSEKNSSERAVSKTQQIRQTYLICIDTLHSSESNLMSFRGSLLKFFRAPHPADSQYILVAMGTSLAILQEATADREKILKAIESKQFQKVFGDSRMAAGNFDLSAFRQRLDRVRVACDGGLPECEEQDYLPTQARQLASEDRVFNTIYFGQFRKLVESLRDVLGRRSIVLISDGFPMVPGMEPIELLLAYFPEFRISLNPATAGQGLSVGSPTTGQSLSLDAPDRMQELGPVLRMASNNNISIYTIDSRGLHTSQYFDASVSGGPGINSGKGAPSAHRPALGVMTALDNVALEAGNTLAEIAESTGGTAFRNSNDLVKGLQLAFADGRQYYMLSYVSTNANIDGKFRAITVKLRDPKMSAKAKRGYWASAN